MAREIIRPEVLNFETGLERVIKTIVSEVNRPVIVGVLGVPNTGKSHLIMRACNEIKQRYGLRGYGSMVDCLRKVDHLGKELGYYMDPVTFDPAYLLLEDVGFPGYIVLLTKKRFNRNPDLVVLMKRQCGVFYDSEMRRDMDNIYGYDLIIVNPESRDKGPV